MPSAFLRIVFWSSALLMVIIGAARVTCLRWWRVPEDDPTLSASLAPTLRGGDWIILWRATPAGFGDLVLCPDPTDASQVVVGRIAAEAGDALDIDGNGSLQVNNSRVVSEAACENSTFDLDQPVSGDPVELRCDVEVLGGVHHQRAQRVAGGLKPAPVHTNVPKDRVYLVSDNRQFPFDSRNYGPVLKDSCAEAVIFRLVSRLGFRDVESRLTVIH